MSMNIETASGLIKPRQRKKTVAVYECAHFEADDSPYAGDHSSYCNSSASGRYECGCKYVYAQKYCPFYKAGRLRGEWVVSEAEIEAARKLKRRLESKRF